jgi:four helix bundle protein
MSANEKLPFEDNLILKLTFAFAIDIIAYAELLESKKKFVVAKQLTKSGTSIGANSFEAQNCESNADFIHKFKIAAKEADETLYWLLICKQAPSYPNPGKLIDNLNIIAKTISKIISTSKKKR